MPRRRTDILSVNEAAERLEVGRNTLYQAIQRGEFPPAVRLGGRIVIRRAFFERWLEGLPEAA
jgi:excisionase family DNA binding protein